MSRQKCVHALDIFTGVIPLDVQIQPDQRKRDFYGFRVQVRLLGCESIHHVLVNERWIWMRERVLGKLVILLLLQVSRRHASCAG
jgi:hypothetical protein